MGSAATRIHECRGLPSPAPGKTLLGVPQKICLTLYLSTAPPFVRCRFARQLDNMVEITSRTAWMTVLLLGAQASLGLLLVRALPAAANSLRSVRTWVLTVHAVIGLALPPLVLAHGWFSMKLPGIRGTSMAGLWIASSRALAAGRASSDRNHDAMAKRTAANRHSAPAFCDGDPSCPVGRSSCFLE